MHERQATDENRPDAEAVLQYAGAAAVAAGLTDISVLHQYDQPDWHPDMSAAHS